MPIADIRVSTNTAPNTLTGEDMATVPVVIPLGPVVLPAPGRYTINLRLDDAPIGDLPFWARQIPLEPPERATEGELDAP